MLKETMIKDVFADKLGNLFSTKSGTLKPIKPCKVNNSRSKKQYWTTSYGLVHRLVASAFIGDPTGLVINHKDGNPSNNSISNLEIVTQRENHLHALASGLAPIGQEHGKAIYTDELLLTCLKEIKEGKSVKSTALKYGISQSYLNKVNNGAYRKTLLVNIKEQL